MGDWWLELSPAGDHRELVLDTCLRVTCPRMRAWGMSIHHPVSHWLRAAPQEHQPSHSSPATASAGRAVGASEVLGQRQARVISSGQVGHQQCQCERGRRKQSAPSTALARIQETLQNVSSTPAVRSRWRRLRLSHQMRHPTRASGFLLVPKQESRLERDVSS